MDFICNPGVKSLYTLSLNQLCITMDETTLRSLLEQLQPSLCLEILWKVRKDFGHEIMFCQMYKIFFFFL